METWPTEGCNEWTGQCQWMVNEGRRERKARDTMIGLRFLFALKEGKLTRRAHQSSIDARLSPPFFSCIAFRCASSTRLLSLNSIEHPFLSSPIGFVYLLVLTDVCACVGACVLAKACWSSFQCLLLELAENTAAAAEKRCRILCKQDSVMYP